MQLLVANRSYGRAVFFSVIGRNVFEMTVKILSHFGQNFLNYRRMNTATPSFK